MAQLIITSKDTTQPHFWPCVITDIGLPWSIFASSDIGIGLENESLKIPDPAGHFPYFLVGHAAFPMSKQLLKPYPGILHSDIEKSVFNYRFSHARRTIENSFGILALRQNGEFFVAQSRQN